MSGAELVLFHVVLIAIAIAFFAAVGALWIMWRNRIEDNGRQSFQLGRHNDAARRRQHSGPCVYLDSTGFKQSPAPVPCCPGRTTSPQRICDLAFSPSLADTSHSDGDIAAK